MARCEICGCPSGIHDSDCRADPTKNYLNVGYREGQVDGQRKLESAVDALIGAFDVPFEVVASPAWDRFAEAFDALRETRKARR